jgi:PAS domain S-box-containing protein
MGTSGRALDNKTRFGDLQLFDAMPQLGWAARPDGYIDYYNQGWYEYTGTTFADMEGWGWQSVHDPDELPRVMESWTRCIATRQPFEQTFPLRRKDGVFRWFLTRVTPIFDDAGELIRWVGINTDVDDQRRAQEALREAEQRFRLVFEGAPIGMIMMRADGRIALVNAHLESLFGYGREELVGEPIEMLIPVPFRAHHPQYREGFLADPRSRAMGKGRDLSGLRKDGSEVAVEVGLSALNTSEGVFVLGSVVDVSERRRAEAVQRHMAAVVESAEDAIITRGLDGAVRSWNPGATRLLGYHADEMVGLSPTRLIPEDRSEEESRVRGEIAAGRRVVHFETVRKRKDGSLVEVSATFTPIHDRGGGVVAASIVMRDITERNQAERERERLVEQLKTLNVDLSQLNSALEQRVLDRTTDLTATLEEREILLQEVHHRVKNNLSVIVSLMEMQARLLGQGEGRHALDECRGRVHAIALIHEKLYQSKNYAKIAFGDYLRSLANDIFQAIGTSPSSVTLAVVVDDDVAITVEKAIPCGLILNELVTNALKYAYPSGSGGTLRVEFKRADEGRLRLAVADDGIGLPPGLNLQETKTLGLRIVSMLVRQLDGELRVNSELGALVEVIFPMERAEA